MPRYDGPRAYREALARRARRVHEQTRAAHAQAVRAVQDHAVSDLLSGRPGTNRPALPIARRTGALARSARVRDVDAGEELTFTTRHARFVLAPAGRRGRAFWAALQRFAVPLLGRSARASLLRAHRAGD